MKTPVSIPSSETDAAVDDLLRQAKVQVPLSGRFQAEVWRRISLDRENRFSAGLAGWMEPLLNGLVRPGATGTAMLVAVGAGLWFGSLGREPARDGKLSYVESVSPFAQEHEENGQ